MAQAGNQDADNLAELGFTQKVVLTSIFIDHLHTPNIQEDTFAKEEEVQQPAVAQNPNGVKVPAVIDSMQEVLVVNPDWTLPILTYLLRQKLLDDEVDARQILCRSKAYIVMNVELYIESVTGVDQHCISPKEGRQTLEEIYSGTC